MNRNAILLSAAALAVLLVGCGPRPTGDFGRAAPGFTHDVAMPLAGATAASLRGEPVSRFNLTDQERLMHDRIWRFVVSPHAQDWFGNFAVELQRTRLTPVGSRRFEISRYYDFLAHTQYRSSPIRYRTIEADVLADLDTLPATFLAICAVIEVDRQRAAALAGLGPVTPDAPAEVAARRAENTMWIDWFVASLRYRHDAYSHALDRLLVETPHPESVAVDRRLQALLGFVVLAERRDFCAGRGQGGQAVAGGGIPSRFTRPALGSDVVDIK